MEMRSIRSVFRGEIAALAMLLAFRVSPAAAQTPTVPSTHRTFDTASIRPAKSPNGGVASQILPGGRVLATNVTLLILLRWAYNVAQFQIVGEPGWASTDSYDISAAPESAATHDEALEMIRTLLADRFYLALHRETKEVPILALTIAKGGARLAKSIDADEMHTSMHGAPHGVTAHATMAHLARYLTNQLGRQVIDRTSLPGLFDFTLEFAPEGNGADAIPGPSIFTALQEQLGLKLEPAKGPVEILVIDHVEKPSQN
jgi:uncharacterized protein (TIGR03435 family)